MNDPNLTYKLAFADLKRKLGRVPNANECLGIHEDYKRAFERERDGKLTGHTRDDGRTGEATDRLAMVVSELGGEEFTAPDVRRGAYTDKGFVEEGVVIDTQVRAREDQEALYGAYREGQAGAPEPLSGPTINAEPTERRSAPEPPSAPPRNYQGLIEGDRGPGGGLIRKCQACGQLWERPRSKGRPAYRCETCR